MLFVAIACAIASWASTKSPPRQFMYVAGIVLTAFAMAMCAVAIRTAIRRPTERGYVAAQPVVADWPDVTTVADQQVRCGDKTVVRHRYDEKECSLSHGAQSMPPSAYRGEPGDFGDFVRSCGPARIRCDAARSRPIGELASTGLVVYITSAGEPSPHRGIGFEPVVAPAHIWWICGVIGVLAAIGALVVRRPGFAVAFALFAATPLAAAFFAGRFA